MSAFKRKGIALQSAPALSPPSSDHTPTSSARAASGTRVSAYNSAVLLSLGIASLDDLFGGGLPVGALLLFEEDDGSSYARLLLKFWIAQGLVCSGQKVIVAASLLESEGGTCIGLTETLPGLHEASSSSLSKRKDENAAREREEEGESDNESGEPAKSSLKIAFRYDSLKQFQTTVDRQSSHDEYCSAFDIGKQLSLTEDMRQRLHCCDIDSPSQSIYDDLYENIRENLSRTDSSTMTRIAIHSLGSITWHDQSSQNSQNIHRFLLRLKSLLRLHNATAIISIPTHAYNQNERGRGVVNRWRHAADSVIGLESFATRPDLAAAFPRYSGLLHVHTLPVMGSLLPASTKLSVLRGLAPGASASAGAGGMDNNLAFRLKRRRFVIETLHLDIGGGETERKLPQDTAQPAATTKQIASEPAQASPLPESVTDPASAKSAPAARPSRIRFAASTKPGGTKKDSSDW